MKVMLIDFVRHNPWGSVDTTTYYFIDGKRVSRDYYFHTELYLHDNYRWDYTETYTKVKDGIDRNYTIIHFDVK